MVEEQAAERLGLPSNEKISIPAIFEDHGEATFRRLERACLDDVLAEEDVVIATGGGTPALDGAMTDILAAGPAVWLHADSETLVARTAGAGDRPLLSGLSRTEAEAVHAELSEKRRPHYARATLSIDVSRGDPEEVAGRVEAALKTVGVGPWSR